MKRYIHSAPSSFSEDVESYVQQAARNIANYYYDHADLAENDPRSDYFVDNLINHTIVQNACKAMVQAFHIAVQDQMRLN